MRNRWIEVLPFIVFGIIGAFFSSRMIHPTPVIEYADLKEGQYTYQAWASGEGFKEGKWVWAIATWRNKPIHKDQKQSGDLNFWSDVQPAGIERLPREMHFRTWFSNTTPHITTGQKALILAEPIGDSDALPPDGEPLHSTEG